MKLAEREEQIIRIQADPSQSDLVLELQATLKQEIIRLSKVTIEAALVEELQAERKGQSVTQPRRSGYFSRRLDSEYGRIEQLQVPKLRWGNKARNWQILTRYQRGLDSLLHFTLCLYVMGLSLRDLHRSALSDFGQCVVTECD